MARARSSGVGPFVVALVFFGLAFVVALILAILFHTRIEAAEAAAKKAADDLNEYANSTERSTVAVSELRGGSGSDDPDAPTTVVGILLSENQRLKQAIRGDGSADMIDITSAMEQLDTSQGNVLAKLSSTQSNLADEKRLVEKWKSNYEEANNRRDEAEAEKTALAQKYDDSVQSLEEQLNQMRAGLTALQEKLGEQSSTFNAQLSSMRSDDQQKSIDFESQLAQKDQVIERLNRRITELQEQLGERGAEGDIDPALLPDGRVASILGAQDLVYIDRGRADHIIRGMTFEVYDGKVGIVRDALGNLRGKATIEVVTIEENASKCRVVRLSTAQEILEGDVIANAAYDPDMVLKFFVYGQFDIDSTGQPTHSDRRRIELMVRRWGAQVVTSQQAGGVPSEITYDVDFLVLGNEPPLPEPPGEDVVDPTVLTDYETRKRSFEIYHGLVKEAQSLSIPILNQNRFLAMTGYYQR